MSDALLVRRNGPITELVLNRPEKANALNVDLVEALHAAVTSAAQDGTRLLVLRGEGKNFCAGFDFSDLERESEGDLLLRFVRIEYLLQALYYAPIATLALCHGGTYGAGADLVCVCDRRIAAPNTKFRMPGLRFGIALGTQRLAQRIGSSAALALQSASRPFTTDDAIKLGFIEAIADVPAWDAIKDETLTQETLEAGAKARLKACVTPDTRAADLALLVESASAPGLKNRIKAFREKGA